MGIESLETMMILKSAVVLCTLAVCEAALSDFHDGQQVQVTEEVKPVKACVGTKEYKEGETLNIFTEKHELCADQVKSWFGWGAGKGIRLKAGRYNIISKSRTLKHNGNKSNFLVLSRGRSCYFYIHPDHVDKCGAAFTPVASKMPQAAKVERPQDFLILDAQAGYEKVEKGSICNRPAGHLAAELPDLPSSTEDEYDSQDQPNTI